MSTTEAEAGRNSGDDARRYAEQRNSEEHDPAEIERTIDATRADVRATLAALERKLSVDRLIELTVGRLRDRGGEFATNLSDAATQNPIPLVLTTIGLGWLMLSTRRDSHGGPYEQPTASERDRATGLKNRVMGAGERVSEQVHGAVDSSREAFGDAAESMRQTASRAAQATRSQVRSAREGVEHAQERVQRMLDEQPLMLGALGLAAGALIGALLPNTETEHRLMGDAREKAVRKVARSSRTKYEAARENAAAYSGPATDEGREPTRRPH
jgi:hypothetical protein